MRTGNRLHELASVASFAMVGLSLSCVGRRTARRRFGPGALLVAIVAYPPVRSASWLCPASSTRLRSVGGVALGIEIPSARPSLQLAVNGVAYGAAGANTAAPTGVFGVACALSLVASIVLVRHQAKLATCVTSAPTKVSNMIAVVPQRQPSCGVRAGWKDDDVRLSGSNMGLAQAEFVRTPHLSPEISSLAQTAVLLMPSAIPAITSTSPCLASTLVASVDFGRVLTRRPAAAKKVGKRRYASQTRIGVAAVAPSGLAAPATATAGTQHRREKRRIGSWLSRSCVLASQWKPLASFDPSRIRLKLQRTLGSHSSAVVGRGREGQEKSIVSKVTVAKSRSMVLVRLMCRDFCSEQWTQ